MKLTRFIEMAGPIAMAVGSVMLMVLPTTIEQPVVPGVELALGSCLVGCAAWVWRAFRRRPAIMVLVALWQTVVIGYASCLLLVPAGWAAWAGDICFFDISWIRSGCLSADLGGTVVEVVSLLAVLLIWASVFMVLRSKYRLSRQL